MKGHIVIRVLAGLVLLAALVGIGAFAFQAGVMQGIAAGGQVPAGEAGKVLPYASMPYRHHFGGFGFFGLLGTLFLVCLAFGALRAMFGFGHHFHHRMFWGYPGMMGMHRMGGTEGFPDVPPMFDEWHRKAHEKESGSGAEEKSA